MNEHSFNYSSSEPEDNSLFRSGKSHMILKVTSSWVHHLLHPRGSMPILVGLCRRFRGDWSQQMATHTSESDSCRWEDSDAASFSYNFFSLTGGMNRVYRNPLVPVARPINTTDTVPGVRVPLFFASGCQPISFRLQTVATLKEGDQWQMWEFIRV